MQSKDFTSWLVVAFASFAGAVGMASYLDNADVYQWGSVSFALVLTKVSAICFSVAIEIHIETAEAADIYKRALDTIVTQTGYRFRLADGTISLIIVAESQGYVVRPVYSNLMDEPMCLDTTLGEIRPDDAGGPYVFQDLWLAIDSAETYLRNNVNPMTYEQQG